jgi:ribosomal-protein-serine acetyltransferase
MADITLRRYQPGDAESLFAAARESVLDLYPWMPWCHPGYALHEARSWLEAEAERWTSGLEYQFAIVSAEGAQLGGCGLNSINPDHKLANLGYWVRSSAAGRGVAPAAVRALRDWAFTATDLQRLELVVASENRRSLRVAEKAGAAFEGTLRQRFLLHGRFHDAALFAFVRPDH